MSSRTLLIGANGQLAQDLRRVWEGEVVGLSHTDVEVSELESVRAAVRQHRPSLVVNTAAYHKTDAVEKDPERAFAVNAIGARNCAIACEETHAALLYVSTDYVFGGDKSAPYVEDDPIGPVNVYGVSKAAGEMLVRYICPRHFIVRTSGLYGVAGSSGKGGNFVELMLRLAGEGKPIRVVDDQTLTPTPTADLARQIVPLVQSNRYGTYHATCQGEASWYGFTTEIFRQARVAAELTPQTTAASQAVARRPPYSVLDNSGLRAAGLDCMPDWREGLAGYLDSRTRVRP
jgi:dTDP-4-dehydrorhamnose reductase